MTAKPRLISIVTPSFQQAAFLEETIHSVLGQQWPGLEYIIMDGGSTDGSAEIIQRHAPSLAYWQSTGDHGQSSAINDGFNRATGEIFAWINSDDFYLPNAFRTAALQLDPDHAEILVANGMTLDVKKRRVVGTDIQRRRKSASLPYFDYILQPATFWTRRAWEKVGPLDQTLHYAFDWDWFIRAEKAGVHFHYSDTFIAVNRVHRETKTEDGSARRDEEIAEIYRRYAKPVAAKFFTELVHRRRRAQRHQRFLKKIRISAVRHIFRRFYYPHVENLTSAEIDQIVQML